MKNFEMKTFKLMMLTALIAITSFSLTSCLNDNSDPSDTTLGTIAAVSYNMGYLTFTNGSLTYIPSASSVQWIISLSAMPIPLYASMHR